MNEEREVKISKATIQRLPAYLRCLQSFRQQGIRTVTSTMVAEALGLNSIQVRKDLALVSSVSGRPKTGFAIQELIVDVRNFLGYDRASEAILVGAGGLGAALIGYTGFADYGLHIVAAFDSNPSLIGRSYNGVSILSVEEMPAFIQENNILMGIITVPKGAAQSVCDIMTDAGVRAVWNFAPVHLAVPQGVALRNEDMAASLAVLSKDLSRLTQD